MSAPLKVATFDRAIFDPAKLREIAKSAKGRRFMVDQRAAGRPGGMDGS